MHNHNMTIIYLITDDSIRPEKIDITKSINYTNLPLVSHLLKLRRVVSVTQLKKKCKRLANEQVGPRYY